MHYVSVEGLTKSYGVKPLFRDISFHIEEGDKIALVAKNGSGKSTLLKILAGKETAEEGTVRVHKEVTVAFLDQHPAFNEEKSLIENIFDHRHPVLDAIRNFELLTEDNHSPDAQELADAIVRMDELSAWNFEVKVKQILGKLQIHLLQQTMKTLSGGQRKRVALARTLIDISFEHKHSLLLMDEPTNHLDVNMIEWLEHYLSQENVTLFLVTHDRYFLDKVCNEIIELDRETLFEYKGDYANFLEKKAAREEADKASVGKARNLLRKELDWMRRQPKARTTKSKSRIDAFYDLKDKASVKTNDQQLELNVKMSRLGGKVIELKKVYKAYGDRIILKGFDYTFKRGERIGVVGENGVGKSTFLNILLGLEPADSGKINIGDTIIFGNYNQQGLQIKEDKRVIEFVKDIAENFPLADGTKVSAGEFLNLFLFPPEQQYTYISKLSGGEKRRLHLLSILFRNPNFLVLDEPTNDLDLQTLNILEDFLENFQGCVVIVSHDRYFMDRLVDHLFVFEGAGMIRDFPGNYSQYREWQKESDRSTAKKERLGSSSAGAAPDTTGERTTAEKQQSKKELPASSPDGSPSLPNDPKKKPSYKEKRELELLSKEIEALEAEKKLIGEKLNSGNTPYETLQELSQRIGELSRLLDEKSMRWLELDEMMG